MRIRRPVRQPRDESVIFGSRFLFTRLCSWVGESGDRRGEGEAVDVTLRWRCGLGS